jgi:hypothetical protein
MAYDPDPQPFRFGNVWLRPIEADCPGDVWIVACEYVADADIPDPNAPPDYRALLTRYMRIVARAEGADLLPRSLGVGDHELAALQAISDEVFADPDWESKA